MRSLPAAWHCRGYLPHYDDGVAVQAICYRLNDALPKKVLAMIDGLEDKHRREAIERYLDVGHGSCLLAEAENASIVEAAWLHFHERRYELHAWCVMPNHVHVLIEPRPGHSVSAIVQSEKSFTAKVILRRYPSGTTLAAPEHGTDGPATVAASRHVWQAEYYDRFIRNDAHYSATVDYIHDNPVRAGLVRRPEDWPWSSARYRLRD